MAVLVLRKNGRKVEFRGWQLLCTKNTPRKLKLSVDSVTQTHSGFWNLALMPKWLRSQERKHSISQKRTQFFINFKMQIQEGNDHIYSNPRGLDYNSKK
jgi:hypothetical protein